MLQPHPLLWTAIENKRMIHFVYHGKDRLVEPHDHGILNGSVQLLSWQVAGRSSRRLPNWLLTKVDEMTDLAARSDLSRWTPHSFRQTYRMGRVVHPGQTRPRLSVAWF
jgi:hypothetical protein